MAHSSSGIHRPLADHTSFAQNRDRRRVQPCGRSAMKAHEAPPQVTAINSIFSPGMPSGV